MVVGVAWHYYDRLPETPRMKVIPLGEWGGFYPGETWLIGFSWLNVALFFINRKNVPASTLPLLFLTFATFFVGMLLASASNSMIAVPVRTEGIDFIHGSGSALFQTYYDISVDFDMTLNGRGFAINASTADTAGTLSILTNWQSLLDR